MPNIIRQSITKDAVSVTGSNGVTVTLTAAQMVAHYQTEPGNATTRRLATIQWVKDQISNGIGDNLLPASDIDFDVDSGTVEPSRLTTGQWQS